MFVVTGHDLIELDGVGPFFVVTATTVLKSAAKKDIDAFVAYIRNYPFPERTPLLIGSGELTFPEGLIVSHVQGNVVLALFCEGQYRVVRSAMSQYPEGMIIPDPYGMTVRLTGGIGD